MCKLTDVLESSVHTRRIQNGRRQENAANNWKYIMFAFAPIDPLWRVLIREKLLLVLPHWLQSDALLCEIGTLYRAIIHSRGVQRDNHCIVIYHLTGEMIFIRFLRSFFKVFSLDCFIFERARRSELFPFLFSCCRARSKVHSSALQRVNKWHRTSEAAVNTQWNDSSCHVTNDCVFFSPAQCPLFLLSASSCSHPFGCCAFSRVPSHATCSVWKRVQLFLPCVW